MSEKRSEDVIAAAVAALSAPASDALSKAVCEGHPDWNEAVEWTERAKHVVLHERDRGALRSEIPNLAQRLMRLLDALMSEPLDEGTPYFQPSQLVITTIDVGNPASNVIPATAQATFNIRFNDRHTPHTLEARLRALLAGIDDRHELAISVSGDSFVTEAGPLTDLLSAAIETELDCMPEHSTSGGTSDARFIKDMCPVVEFGLVGQTMHQIDERVALSDLEALTRVYRGFLERYLAAA